MSELDERHPLVDDFTQLVLITTVTIDISFTNLFLIYSCYSDIVNSKLIYIMDNREYFLKILKEEVPIFERILQAVPDDNLSYTPHEKSKTAWSLIKDTFGGESASYPIFLKQGKYEVTQMEPKDYQTVDDVIKDMKENFSESAKLIETMTEEDWNSDAEMLMNGQSMWKSTKGDMAWGLLLDLIHHRGQLSTYLRPMGGKVPSIYGPSADDPGQN